MAKRVPANDRFWSYVDKSGDCWEWGGERLPAGYGKIKIGRRYWLAHRYAFLLEHGAIPEGSFVCHSCDNPPCVNPAHLWPGTALENTLDAIFKQRTRYPITMEQLLSIYEIAKARMKPAQIARELGLSNHVVNKAVDGRTYEPVFRAAHPEMYDMDFGDDG